MTTARFAGFPPEAMRFLGELKANNDRDWFTAHRGVYDTAIRAPAEAFVAVALPEIEALAQGPVSAKIFRIHRDVRFSKDKSPYNAHLHIGFALEPRPGEGRAPRCGFYFGLEPERLHLGAGMFEFDGEALDRYRAAVADEAEGGALGKLIEGLARDGCRLNDPQLKRTPAPYAPDHPRGDLLRRKGLAAWREITDRSLIESHALFDETLAAFRRLASLNAWIASALDA
ncbi:DUF2461 domain-containing protein [Phenylobacterium sp.]|jgi:uncharacterized protein (TIGR02453 family)|uniref:DUF2461 domain-containing protein n=1 Tax=Phenylobacterium sp. TaxID=1871053 RepID=UPI002F41679D